MKNSKITIAAFTIIFAVLVSNANESAEKQIIIQTEFATPNYQGIPLDSENIICANHVLPTVSDRKMREDYNTLHEEEDALFEFDTLNYLPSDFDAYSEDEAILAALELLNEEDILFEFDTLDYLPADFNAYSEDESNLAALELLNEEEDAPFDFNTSDYLPINFYASK